MKKTIVVVLTLCISSLVNSQADSLIHFLNMTFEELLNVKITTAGKSEQQVKDIPASVVVITRADIENNGYRSLSEILGNVTGMYLTNDYSLGGANMGVRGYWSVIPNNNLMIFVNDVDQINLPYSSYFLDGITVPVEAIERIEIIRGPMSVLYGSGAFFGVINIFTKNYGSDKSVVSQVSGSAGTQHTGKAMLRLSNNTKDFSYSLNVSAFNSSGINQPYKKMNDKDSLFKTSTTKNLLKQGELYFGFNAKLKNFYTDISYNESKYGFMFIFPSAGNGSILNSSSLIMTMGNKKIFWNQWTVDCKLTYYSSLRKASFDSFFKNAYEYQDVPGKGWDADLTLNSDLSQKLHFTAGAKYRNIFELENNLHLPTNGFGFYYNTTQTIGPNNTIGSWAGFAQLNYTPVKKLQLVAGCRLEQRHNFTLRTIIADTLFGVPAQIISENYTQHKVEFIPRLAVIYSITNKHILKFMYGKAINTPSWFQIINGGPHNLDLRSQFIQSFELNYMTAPFPKILINSSVFYNKMNDLIVRTIGLDDQGKFYNYNSNTGQVETKGVELSLQMKPAFDLDCEISCTYQKSVDLSNPNITYNYSPNFLGNLKLSYHITPKINATLITNFVDKMETYWLDYPGESGRIGKAVPAYMTLAGNFRVHDLFMNGLYFELHGTNLFNQDILYPVTTNNYMLFPKGTIGMGRQFLLTAGYKF